MFNCEKLINFCEISVRGKNPETWIKKSAITALCPSLDHALNESVQKYIHTLPWDRKFKSDKVKNVAKNWKMSHHPI